eukprot:scaffold1619_cov121-Isochrysis_galbana.AAC.12
MSVCAAIASDARRDLFLRLSSAQLTVGPPQQRAAARSLLLGIFHSQRRAATASAARRVPDVVRRGHAGHGGR